MLVLGRIVPEGAVAIRKEEDPLQASCNIHQVRNGSEMSPSFPGISCSTGPGLGSEGLSPACRKQHLRQDQGWELRQDSTAGC